MPTNMIYFFEVVIGKHKSAKQLDMCQIAKSRFCSRSYINTITVALGARHFGHSESNKRLLDTYTENIHKMPETYTFQTERW